MKSRIHIVILLLVYCVPCSWSQLTTDTIKNPVQPIDSRQNKLVWGGYLTLQVGTVTVVAVSPQVGYFITSRMLVGTGVSYVYYSEKWYNDRISSSIYGGRIFNECTVYQSLYKSNKQKPNFSFISHAEYELINIDRDFSNPNLAMSLSRFWIHGILIGGGYRQHLGQRSSFHIVLLYNIINDKRSPYDNPQIRIGFYF